MILQMIANRDDKVLANALGPLLYFKDETSLNVCRTLHRIVVENVDTSGYIVIRYTQYWHGYNSISAALLLISELSNVRFGLRLALYVALLLLVLATGKQQRRLLALSVSIAVIGAFFWAAPYFGQSLCHGPGDIFVIFGITCLLFWRKHLSQLPKFVLFCAAYGAGVVYLEFLIGLLPTALGLLFPTAYAIAILQPDQEKQCFQAWMFAITGLLAFAFSASLTVILKQILSIYFSDPYALDLFLGKLKNYVISASSFQTDSFQKYPPILETFRILIIKGDRLTYGSKLGAKLLFITTAFAWMASIYLAICRFDTGHLSDLLAFAIGPVVVVCWVYLFQKHTYIHSDFIVRILIVPISLGWAALTWQLTSIAGRKFFHT
jgi:hypothetical protein